MRKILPVFMLLAMTACSMDKPARTAGGVQEPGKEAAPAAQAPAVSQYQAEILPAAADRNTTFVMIPKGFSLSAARIEWLLNGAPTGISGTSYKPADVKMGDSVQVQVTVMVTGETILSNAVQIGNTPPALTNIRLMPEFVKAGDRVYVEAEATDPEGDPVELRYEWTKNGQPAGTGKMLDDTLQRGDRYSVRITPCDREGCGKALSLMREVRNIPPAFSPDRPHSFDGGVFSQTFHATDPDGDQIIYSLKACPAGMTINPATGQIMWPVPADFSGKALYTVCASDGNSEATETHSFSIPQAP